MWAAGPRTEAQLAADDLRNPVRGCVQHVLIGRSPLRWSRHAPDVPDACDVAEGGVLRSNRIYPVLGRTRASACVRRGCDTPAHATGSRSVACMAPRMDPDPDRARVLALLQRHGWNATSFQVLEPGFSLLVRRRRRVRRLRRHRAARGSRPARRSRRPTRLARGRRRGSSRRRRARAGARASSRPRRASHDGRRAGGAADRRAAGLGPAALGATCARSRSLREQLRRARAKGVRGARARSRRARRRGTRARAARRA